MLRLNEDGEVDFRGSWRDTWHQRGLLVLNFAFLILGFALLFVGIYAIRTNPVGSSEILTPMHCCSKFRPRTRIQSNRTGRMFTASTRL